ncbi:hypothetical protein Smp_152950 [Schistosoma mansoni]|uniref:hypothetical protein n=1 Tax=Schistosoma mansoni TaxID=6183 RepID=UPI0001A63516|nr:hypothetical protein Smp_152950 [Schistosoma mansoni]|eukprot:XP_018653599.1 hypothetical protein Smp_152950 [Schistosoma mansoni]
MQNEITIEIRRIFPKWLAKLLIGFYMIMPSIFERVSPILLGTFIYGNFDNIVSLLIDHILALDPTKSWIRLAEDCQVAGFPVECLHHLKSDCAAGDVELLRQVAKL